MGVPRWTEWRTRLDAVRAGLVRDWTLPEPEARGYGRGAVRVLELAFIRTREVTKRVGAIKEECASRAERRREEPQRAKAGRRLTDPPPVPAEFSSGPIIAEELVSPVAGLLWPLIERVQSRLASPGPSRASPRPPPG